MTRKRNTSSGARDRRRAPSSNDSTTERARVEVRERLLDLAYDVSSYLRHQAQPTVRISAALLLAASLAACSGDQSEPSGPPSDVQPLTQEIRNGMPNRPGEYPVVPESIIRDQQGVYHFQWLQPGGASGPGSQAAVSLLKLGQADTNTLVVPQTGDPLLNITPNTPIQLATTSAATPTTQRIGSDYVYWHPFYGGYYYGPRYYDPPVRTIPSGGTVEGSTSSVSPQPASARTVGVSHAVSGRAGGAGAGNAATNKSGASASGGGKSSAAAPASSGFSGGSSASKAGGGGSSSSSSS